MDLGVHRRRFLLNLGHRFETFGNVPKNVRTAEGAKLLSNIWSKKLFFISCFDANLSGPEVFEKLPKETRKLV